MNRRKASFILSIFFYSILIVLIVIFLLPSGLGVARTTVPLFAVIIITIVMILVNRTVLVLAPTNKNNLRSGNTMTKFCPNCRYRTNNEDKLVCPKFFAT
jgi:hypothetical protein